jgi:transcriptional regulator with XRE-family HTH domain
MELEGLPRHAALVDPVIPNISQLGEAVRKMRKEKTDLTVEEFALEIGTDYSYLSDIESNGRNLTWKKLSSIVKRLGVKPSVLIECAEMIARDQQTESQRDSDED